MQIKLMTMTALLAVGGTALAQTPAQATLDYRQYNQDVRQLNTDIRNNRADVSKDESDAAHDRRDIGRDRSIRNADKLREERDLASGNTKGAAYWNTQRKDENAEIRHDRADLAHSEKDVSNAKTRLAKDVSVRNHDAAKRAQVAKKR